MIYFGLKKRKGILFQSKSPFSDNFFSVPLSLFIALPIIFGNATKKMTRIPTAWLWDPGGISLIYLVVVGFAVQGLFLITGKFNYVKSRILPSVARLILILIPFLVAGLPRTFSMHRMMLFWALQSGAYVFNIVVAEQENRKKMIPKAIRFVARPFKEIGSLWNWLKQDRNWAENSAAALGSTCFFGMSLLDIFPEFSAIIIEFILGSVMLFFITEPILLGAISGKKKIDFNLLYTVGFAFAMLFVVFFPVPDPIVRIGKEYGSRVIWGALLYVGISTGFSMQAFDKKAIGLALLKVIIHPTIALIFCYIFKIFSLLPEWGVVIPVLFSMPITAVAYPLIISFLGYKSKKLLNATLWSTLLSVLVTYRFFIWISTVLLF